jgi:hypothetical protein
MSVVKRRLPHRKPRYTKVEPYRRVQRRMRSTFSWSSSSRRLPKKMDGEGGLGRERRGERSWWKKGTTRGVRSKRKGTRRRRRRREREKQKNIEKRAKRRRRPALLIFLEVTAKEKPVTEVGHVNRSPLIGSSLGDHRLPIPRSLLWHSSS